MKSWYINKTPIVFQAKTNYCFGLMHFCIVCFLSACSTLQHGVGIKEWTYQTGSTGNSRAYGIATDQTTGAIYVTGRTDGTLDGNQRGRESVFLIKYDQAGTKRGTQQFGWHTSDTAYDVAVDQNIGAVYVTGNTWGNPSESMSMGGANIFLVKFKSSGAIEWVRQAGTDEVDYAYGVAVDQATGAIYVTGYTEGSIDGNTNAGKKDILLIKYSPSGDKEWTRQVGSPRNDFAYDVVVHHKTGAIYVTGYTEDVLYGHSNSGKNDIFLIKYKPSGDYEWSRQVGSTRDDYARGMAVDQTTGAVYITGHTGGNFEWNIRAGYDDVFLIKYKPSGDKEWIRQIGSTDDDYAYGVAIDQTTGAVYITGETKGDFDGNKHAGSDTFLIKYNSDGDKQWTRQIGSTLSNSASSVVVYKGNIYVVGETQSDADGNTHFRRYNILFLKYR